MTDPARAPSPARPPRLMRRSRRRPDPARFAAARFALPPRPGTGPDRAAPALGAAGFALCLAALALRPVPLREETREEPFLLMEEKEPPRPEPPPPPPPPPPPKKPADPAPPEKRFGLEPEALAEESDLAVSAGNTVDTAPERVIRLIPPAPAATAPEAPAEKIGSLGRVSRMPRVLNPSKPEYTAEMRRNGIAGKVKARVLVGADGKVSRVEILADLGFGTREAAEAALRRMEFEPAVQDGAPVALWIPFTYTFEWQE